MTFVQQASYHFKSKKYKKSVNSFFQFLTKICVTIFDQNCDFWPKFRLLTKILSFHQKIRFLFPKSLDLIKPSNNKKFKHSPWPQIVTLFFSFFVIVQKWYLLGKCSQIITLFRSFFFWKKAWQFEVMDCRKKIIDLHFFRDHKFFWIFPHIMKYIFQIFVYFSR